MGKQQETPEQAAARRAADAQRKRDERARKKVEKEQARVAEVVAQAKSFPEYWQQQRAQLTEAQRAEYEARESDVLDLEFAMKKYVEGNYDDVTDPENRVPLSAIIEEVKEEVATHGICESIILVVPRLWTEQEKNLREAILRKRGATVQLLQYGYRLALDGKLYTDFHQKFLMKRQPRVETPQVFVSLKCSTCNTPPVSVTSEIAAAYARTRDYKCANCLERAAKIRKFAQEQRSPEHVIFDNWGRVLDQ